VVLWTWGRFVVKKSCVSDPTELAINGLKLPPLSTLVFWFSLALWSSRSLDLWNKTWLRSPTWTALVVTPVSHEAVDIDGDHNKELLNDWKLWQKWLKTFCEKGVAFVDKKKVKTFGQSQVRTFSVSDVIEDVQGQKASQQRVRRGHHPSAAAARTKRVERAPHQKSRPEVQSKDASSQASGRGWHQCTATPPQSSGEVL
jgi:hypothetical protein